MKLGTVALSANSVAPGAPEWVHLMPLGDIQGRDGRQYTLRNAQAIIDDFDARAVDLPIDFEHQTLSAKETRVGPVPAAGWIKELKAKPDGIWGRVEWTVTAKNMISEKEYRYISPVMMHRLDEIEVRRLTGAGLVHHPNLTLTALASEEDTMDDQRPIMHRIAQRLGLADGASENEIMQALEDALSKDPDPEKFVPIEAMQSIMDDRFFQTSEHAETRALAKVDDAVKKGHILPPMKAWATALCRQNEASFDAFIAGSVPAYGHADHNTHGGASAGISRQRGAGRK